MLFPRENGIILSSFLYSLFLSGPEVRALHQTGCLQLDWAHPLNTDMLYGEHLFQQVLLL
jgi:hypothetical protein